MLQKLSEKRPVLYCLLVILAWNLLSSIFIFFYATAA
jgi:hypothetical protein